MLLMNIQSFSSNGLESGKPSLTMWMLICHSAHFCVGPSISVSRMTTASGLDMQDVWLQPMKFVFFSLHGTVEPKPFPS